MTRTPKHKAARTRRPAPPALPPEAPIASALGPAQHQARIDREVVGRPPRVRR